MRLMHSYLLTIPVVALLMCFNLSGCSSDQSSMVDSLLKKFMPPSPAEVAQNAFNVDDPDLRRRSILLLANATWGGDEPYMKMYRLMINDPDPMVRSACLVAFSIHGTSNDVSCVLPYVEDESKAVRWEAVKTLQRLHHDDVVPVLTRALVNDPDSDVRMAAANALGQYRKPIVFETLIGALRDRDYGVVLEAEKSLITLTGQNLGTEGKPWLTWAKKTDDVFSYARIYYYPEYERPKRLMDRVQFWKKAVSSVPQEPRDTSSQG